MKARTPVIAFFNNKGGVGKTSLVYNLAWMYTRLNQRVLSVDLDPQSNFTSLCLDDEALEGLWDTENKAPQPARTIYDAVRRVIRGEGDISALTPTILDDSDRGYHRLIPGDLRLSQFEDVLSQAWNEVLGARPKGINITSGFGRIIQQAAHEHEANLALVDMGPNLGAINRAALIAADYVVVPLVPDLFSLQGLKNLGGFLNNWQRDWQDALTRSIQNGDFDEQMRDTYPPGMMQPLGYVILQHRERQSRFVASHGRWSARIPITYSRYVLGDNSEPDMIEDDPHKLGLVRNYQSLMAMSHEARKPIFELKPADGAIGSHTRVVLESHDTFEALALTIAQRAGLMLSVSD